VLIRIEGSDLPGGECGAGPDFPDGHHNIHVAVQGRKGQQDLYGLIRADAKTVSWDLDCTIASPPPVTDLRGPIIHGAPRRRFIYLTWGVVDDDGTFTMFRRAKLLFDAVPPIVMARAIAMGGLVGQLGLTDDQGWPLCAAVRPPRILWTATTTG